MQILKQIDISVKVFFPYESFILATNTNSSIR